MYYYFLKLNVSTELIVPTHVLLFSETKCVYGTNVPTHVLLFSETKCSTELIVPAHVLLFSETKCSTELMSYKTKFFYFWNKSIFRIGNELGHTTDGVFQYNKKFSFLAHFSLVKAWDK